MGDKEETKTEIPEGMLDKVDDMGAFVFQEGSGSGLEEGEEAPESDADPIEEDDTV